MSPKYTEEQLEETIAEVLVFFDNANEGEWKGFLFPDGRYFRINRAQ